jgi:hypothetical protein
MNPLPLLNFNPQPNKETMTIVSYIPDFLQDYIATGWALFPCRQARSGRLNKDGTPKEDEKSPLTTNGFKDATLDELQLLWWHLQHPGCAWGTPTSADKGVIDIDPRNGGTESWAALEAEYGGFPPTRTVRTGGGGYHKYVRFPPGTRCGKLAPGIDVKADGGFVIIPPSKIHIPEHEGRSYLWENADADIAIAPDWVVGLLAKPKASTPTSSTKASAVADPWIVQPAYTLATHPGTPEGRRRVTLCELVGPMITSGCDADSIMAEAEAWANRCNPPFDEWRKHVRGLLTKEALKERKNPPTPDSFFPSTATAPAPVPDDMSEREVVTLSPAIHPDAYHGTLGALVTAISPHTEADESALLVCLLTAVGSAVGFNPHFDHGKRHGANLFTGLVGPTASRKGTATGIAKAIITDADPEWEQRVQHEGFGSGEGLIWAVRDANPLEPVGVTDKRLMVIEEEWSKAFTLSASDKSILTPLIRNAFDRIPIGKNNKGDNAYACKQPHISILANITPDDLRQSLTGKHAVSIANGFLNRFLLVATRRTKFLPRGGRWKEHANPFIPAIRDAIQKARTRTLMELDTEAEAEWDALYPELENRPDGVLGAVTGRASDMVMKLALVYALADGVDAIGIPHLRAGLAVWRYCEATAFGLFGVPPTSTSKADPEPLWLRLLNAITSAPGVSRSELTRTHQRYGNAEAIGLGLDSLRGNGLAHANMVKPQGSGRTAECWYPGEPDNHPLSPTHDADPWIVRVEGKKESPNAGEANSFFPSTVPAEAEPAELGETREGGCHADGQDAEGWTPEDLALLAELEQTDTNAPGWDAEAWVNAFREGRG